MSTKRVIKLYVVREITLIIAIKFKDFGRNKSFSPL